MQPDAAESATAYELFQRGSRMLAERHPGAAAVLLERALALEPGKASILEALGRAYFNVGSHELRGRALRAQSSRPIGSRTTRTSASASSRARMGDDARGTPPPARSLCS